MLIWIVKRFLSWLTLFPGGINSFSKLSGLEKRIKRAKEDAQEIYTGNDVTVYEQGIQKGILIFAELIQEHDIKAQQKHKP